METKNCIFIKFEGRIASGKTTLAEKIYEFLEFIGMKVEIISKSSSETYIKNRSKKLDVIILDD